MLSQAIIFEIAEKVLNNAAISDYGDYRKITEIAIVD